MNLLEVPDSGSVIFEGKAYTSDEKSKSGEKIGKAIDLRRSVGMVFQQFNLFPHLTVLENLTLSPMWVSKVPRKEADDAVEIARTTSGVQKVVKVFEYID